VNLNTNRYELEEAEEWICDLKDKLAQRVALCFQSARAILCFSKTDCTSVQRCPNRSSDAFRWHLAPAVSPGSEMPTISLTDGAAETWIFVDTRAN